MEIIDDFKRIIKKDADQFGIKFDLVARSFDMTIIPMHRSEWSSILYNLYSNAKKAIVRAKKDIGIIRIVVGNLNDDTAFIDFEDNGDGIPKKIGNVFLTLFLQPHLLLALELLLMSKWLEQD